MLVLEVSMKRVLRKGVGSLLTWSIFSLILLAACYPPSASPATQQPMTSAPSAAVPSASSPSAQKTPGALTKVTLAMGYIPSVQFAPFYVAQERGYFRDAGLSVTFRYGMESDLLKLVGTNELQFMIGSGEEVILGRSQELPVRYVMRWYRHFPVVLFAEADKGIRAPLTAADLVGKKIGVPGLYGASYVGWEAIVYATGLNPEQVTLQSIGFTQASAVSENQVDAAMDYVVNGPVQLRLAGQEVTVIPVSDLIDLPSNGIITNDQTIKEHPELVRALVSAAMHGLQDTLADPNAAFDISLKAVPEAGGQQATVSRAIFDESLRLWEVSEAESRAPGGAELGQSDPATWKTAADFMKAMGLIQNDVQVEDLYTNEFVSP
jgi:NitT/TauT family transport system substrate-binding protein